MRTLFAAMLLIAPAFAVAQDRAAVQDHAATAQDRATAGDTVEDQAPRRIRSVALAAGQKCPPAEGNEIVVCSTIEEPYRIPKELRRSEPTAANRSWAARTEVVDDAGRRAAGIPNSCSTTGSGGQTGCTQQLLEQWTAEQRARRAGTQIP